MRDTLDKGSPCERGISHADSCRGQADEICRFYAGLCAPYLHEPTRDRISVIQSGDKGEGLITLCDIRKGELVFRFWGRTVSEQTLFTLQKEPGVYIDDPIVMGKILHSCDPNMGCNMETQTFTALRQILAREYLTIDYERTEDVLYRTFNCQCGSPLCRGPIQGRAAR